MNYETHSGVLVRSKSELMIANMLEERGIPYRYEQGLSLPVDWMDDISATEDGFNNIIEQRIMPFM